MSNPISNTTTTNSINSDIHTNDNHSMGDGMGGDEYVPMLGLKSRGNIRGMGSDGVSDRGSSVSVTTPQRQVLSFNHVEDIMLSQHQHGHQHEQNLHISNGSVSESGCDKRVMKTKRKSICNKILEYFLSY